MLYFLDEMSLTVLYMLLLQTVVLVEKDVIASYFAQIAAELPESCLQGTAAYMRRVLNTM